VVAIGDDAYAINRPIGLKQRADGVFGGAEAQISNKIFFKLIFLSAVAEQ